MKGRQTVLAVAAHPDDEVIGIGGTIAKHALNGDDVYVAILTEGSSAQYPDDHTRIAALKKQQAHQVAGLLGVKDLFIANFEELRLGAQPIFQVSRFIEDIAAKVRPSIIYTHHFSDLNQDHRVAYEAATIAARPLTLPCLEKLFCYPVDPMSHLGNGPAQFNYYVDITETLERKLQAMKAYDTEVREYPHPRSLEALRQVAGRNGALVGLRAAEIFQLVLAVER
jgi:N-acetylglucosamine malate deacetylase 1